MPKTVLADQTFTILASSRHVSDDRRDDFLRDIAQQCRAHRGPISDVRPRAVAERYHLMHPVRNDDAPSMTKPKTGCHICGSPRAACFNLESATPPYGWCLLLESSLKARHKLRQRYKLNALERAIGGGRKRRASSVKKQAKQLRSPTKQAHEIKRRKPRKRTLRKVVQTKPRRPNV